MEKRSGTLCCWRRIIPSPPQQQLASSCIIICFFMLRSWLLVCILKSLSIPFFIAAYCSPPNSPVNGTVHSLTGTKLGSTLRFSCDQGFRLIGQSSATCTRTAQGIYQWNAPVPLCQGKGLITWKTSLSFWSIIYCTETNSLGINYLEWDFFTLLTQHVQEFQSSYIGSHFKHFMWGWLIQHLVSPSKEMKWRVKT